MSNWVQRPEVEACNDSPHGKLTEEVAELKESIKLLQLKLRESEESLGEMQSIKQKLESDIKVKSNSLLIDQQKCMSMRRTLPYNIVATRYYWGPDWDDTLINTITIKYSNTHSPSDWYAPDWDPQRDSDEILHACLHQLLWLKSAFLPQGVGHQ